MASASFLFARLVEDCCVFGFVEVRYQFPPVAGLCFYFLVAVPYLR